MTQLLRLFVFAAALCLPAVSFADTVVYIDANHARIIDTNADDLGDVAVGISATAVAIGETNNETADQQEGRFWMPFAMSAAQRSEILNASSVHLSVYLTGKQNIANFNVDLIGLTNRTSTAAALSDYQAAGTVLIDGAITPGSTLGQHTFDVTSFVQQEAAVAGSIIAFRMQIDPATMPIVDGLKSNYIVYSLNAGQPVYRPQLIVAGIPEPAGLGILSIAGGMIAMMRRRLG